MSLVLSSWPLWCCWPALCPSAGQQCTPESWSELCGKPWTERLQWPEKWVHSQASYSSHPRLPWLGWKLLTYYFSPAIYYYRCVVSSETPVEWYNPPWSHWLCGVSACVGLSYTPFGALQIRSVTQEVREEAVEQFYTGPDGTGCRSVHTFAPT